MAAATTEQQILAVYRDTIDTLYGYVSRSCDGDRALAEDVTQETWLRAVREWRHKGPPRNPIAWLTTVARNLLVNHYKRSRSVPLDSAPSDALGAGPGDAGSDSAETSRENESLVRRAIARLPGRQARVIEAFHFERRKVAQIAESLGVSERAVEGRLRRARQKLRSELESLRAIDGGEE